MSIFKNVYFRISLISEVSVLPYFLYNEIYLVPLFIAAKWAAVLFNFIVEKIIAENKPPAR